MLNFCKTYFDRIAHERCKKNYEKRSTGSGGLISATEFLKKQKPEK